MVLITTKRKVYIASPQPKWDIVLNFESKKDKVYKTSPEITATEKPVTHLKKYKTQQNRKYYVMSETKRHKYLHIKAQIKSKFFTAFDGWPAYFIEESISGMKDCNWSINCLVVATKIMIRYARDVINFHSTTWPRKDNKLL